MPIAITCPACNHSGNAPNNLNGQIVRCPKCSTKFRVPGRDDEILTVTPAAPCSADDDIPTATRATPLGGGQVSAAHLYLYINQQKKGPFAESQLRAMWNSGAITADALYWREGMSGWAPICEMLEGSGRAASRSIRYDPRTDTFRGTLSAVVKLAIRAVHDLGYRIDNANESLGLLTFQTGMTWSSWNGALCSLSFEERGPNTFRPIASAKANQSGGQVFAPDLFGELKGKATKVIDRMAELAS